MIRSIRVLICALPLLAASGPPSPFTIHQLLGYPYPLELVTARNGAAIAWIFNERGARNIYTAAAPEWKARRLTNFPADDGQELTQVSFTGDGKGVVFVRGGDHDGNWPADQPPNPAQFPRKPTVQIWLAPVSGDTARVLTEGDQPAPSPRGDVIAFIQGGQAYSVPVAGGEAKPLFYVRGTTSGLRWSPDGSRLGFVTDRGTHSFIGIYAGPDTPLKLIAPSTFGDFDLHWSPDGNRVAFVRLPLPGGAPQPILREVPQPWSIMVADVATGLARKVWQSPNTLRGSYPQVAGGANLNWGTGDRLVFLAELDGWEHLYSVSAAGGTPTLLTPGTYMVEHVTVSPDHSFIVYSANHGADPSDDDRRHLFRVPVDRPDATPITRGLGVEWTPVVTGDGSAVAYISATVQRPPLPTVSVFGSAAPPSVVGLDRLPPDFPGSQFVIPKKVTFKAADGVLIHGQLFAQEGLKGKNPAVIFVHGGPPRQMMLGWHYMDYYSNAYAMNQYLASRGFVVLSVNYRLGIGYGREFQHPDRAGYTGASEYQDVLAGARYLAAQATVDPKRIGIWGGSYGGYLTAMALARNSDLFAAGVDLHGVHDWGADVKELYVKPSWRYEKGDVDSAVAVAYRSSPIASMKTWRSPVLLIQGDDDHNVHFAETVNLARRLEVRGIRFEELVLPDELHGFLLHQSWLSADSATAAFLAKELRLGGSSN